MPRDPRSIIRRQPIPKSVSQPLATPLFPSVVYASRDADELEAQYEGSAAGFTYSREGHPNAQILADKIAWLEGMTEEMGRSAAASSGMAAISAILLSLLSAGDHVVASDQLYGRTLRLLKTELPRLGIGTSFVDATRAEAIAQAIRPNTRMILIETSSNPTIRIADIDAAVELARKNDILLAVDNTFATPRGYRPFDHGANIVIHSVTKMLSGHSDAMLGWAGADTPSRNQAIEDAIVTWGLVASPFDCWLAERGLHSFDLRFSRAQSNAAMLAEALAEIENVEQVIFPGRADHPEHERARRLFGENMGNMVSFRLRGGRQMVNAFLQSAAPVSFAPTLGDIATTISHPASSSHRGMPEEDRLALGITEGFIRVSVGCEEPGQIVGEIVDAARNCRSR